MLNSFSGDSSAVPARTLEVLLPVASRSIGEEVSLTVDARELHAFLECKTRFNDWITERIEQYGFLENKDFASFTENSVKPKGGRPSKEYFLTLDMAKELCMVERNEKGRQARRYFLDCEKRLREPSGSKDVLDRLSVLIEAEREILAGRAQVKALTATVEEMRPDQEFCKAVRASREELTPTVFAKEISAALNMKVMTIVDRMVDEGMLFRRGSGKKKKLLSKENPKYPGWFRMRKEQRWDAGRGEYVPCDQVMVTGFGQQQIFKKWNIPEPVRLFALTEAK